jgi:hypothetical protein
MGRHWYVLGLSVLMAGGLVVCGAVAVRTGWVLPWQRRHIVRPRMWGYGGMLFGVGLLVQMVDGAMDGLDTSLIPDAAVTMSGLLLMVAGAWFQLLGTRERLDT